MSIEHPPFAYDLEPRGEPGDVRRIVSAVLRRANAVERERIDRYSDAFARVHFWPLVDRDVGPSECLIWRGSVDDYGYGYFSAHGGKTRAHRYALELVEGWLPSEVYACHACNDRRCCRVDARHVYAGTAIDNGRDLSARNARVDAARDDRRE